jgi:hypothetical protein
MYMIDEFTTFDLGTVYFRPQRYLHVERVDEIDHLHRFYQHARPPDKSRSGNETSKSDGTGRMSIELVQP